MKTEALLIYIPGFLSILALVLGLLYKMNVNTFIGVCLVTQTIVLIVRERRGHQ